jgi:hypothetical protein
VEAVTGTGTNGDAGKATGNEGVGADVIVDRGVGRASVGWDCVVASEFRNCVSCCRHREN